MALIYEYQATKMKDFRMESETYFTDSSDRQSTSLSQSPGDRHTFACLAFILATFVSSGGLLNLELTSLKFMPSLDVKRFS
jgi:hypothetical protein